MEATTRKPLGQKSYGSIPHLPGSRMGPGDHHCHEGQARIATSQSRDRHDLIIVQEKLDGSNVSVAKVGGVIYPLTRAGYHANTSPYEQHHKFAGWVQRNWERFNDFLSDGERICGEWLLQAHGTRYALTHEPFVAFDIMSGMTRLPFDSFIERIHGKFTCPNLLHAGGPLSITQAMEHLRSHGWHGALDPVEGAVWRVERKGRLDFIVKYVRPDKKDGVYLPEISGKPPVWNAEI